MTADETSQGSCRSEWPMWNSVPRCGNLTPRFESYLSEDCTMKLRALFALLVLAAHLPADEIARSEKLPETMPWNLAELSEPPKFEWADREGPVRSLFYAGEKYDGKPTRVFAYYATPGTLAGKETLDEKFPAVVLIHGGG